MSEDNDDQMIIDEHEVSDGDVGLYSTQDALKEIQNAWLNEKFAPEILPHKMDLVESIIDQVDYFEEQLKRLNKNDIRYDIHTMELSRIRFVISSYIRARLDKIERFVYYILKQEQQREDRYLTDKELQFANEYKTSVEMLFQNVALQYFPRVYQQINDEIKPNLNSHVVLKVNKPGNVVMVDEDVDVELELNTQYVIPYKAVAELVKNGTVQLI